MNNITLDIAKVFSRYPAGRLQVDGPFSGERFRNEVIAPALRRFEKVTILLDGAAGYGSSFLEEAFGGLIRDGFELAFLQARLDFVSEDESLPLEIWSYMEDEDSRKAAR